MPEGVLQQWTLGRSPPPPSLVRGVRSAADSLSVLLTHTVKHPEAPLQDPGALERARHVVSETKWEQKGATEVAPDKTICFRRTSAGPVDGRSVRSNGLREA